MPEATDLLVTPTAAEAPVVHVSEAAVMKIARELARELQPGRRAVERAGLDNSLDQDWGFDSLSRAELLLRCGKVIRTPSLGRRTTATSASDPRLPPHNPVGDARFPIVVLQLTQVVVPRVATEDFEALPMHVIHSQT